MAGGWRRRRHEGQRREGWRHKRVDLFVDVRVDNSGLVFDIGPNGHHLSEKDNITLTHALTTHITGRNDKIRQTLPTPKDTPLHIMAVRLRKQAVI